MCAICGCTESVHDVHHVHDDDHEAGHDHSHPLDSGYPASESGVRSQYARNDHEPFHEPGLIRLEQDVLARNDHQAAHNRAWLRARGAVAVNLMSSPGAGKTSLLERTIREHGQKHKILVIEGDQETDQDSERIRAAGAEAVQINTGTGCHLDASMVDRALRTVTLSPGTFVFIENVGNLVCPAMFDLGEAAKVVIASVTEGDDKPLKYPHMFRAADVILLSKMDLEPYVPFDSDRFHANVRRVNPKAGVIRLSTLRGKGLFEWYAWLAGRADAARTDLGARVP